MTKRISKFISILLAAVMVLSMALTGLAAEVDPLKSSADTKGSITINNAVVGEDYTIYQIFELTYADDGSSVSYTVVSPWGTFLEDSYKDYFILSTVDDVTYLDPSSKIFSESTDNEVMVKFAQDALAYAQATEGITGETKTATSTDETATYTTVQFSDLKLGYYLVDTSLGSLCMLTSTEPTVTITEKNEVPTTEKYVDWDEEESVDNERTVNFEIDVNNVKGISNLVIHDQMETDADDYEFLFNTLTVSLKDTNSTAVTLLTKDVDYVVIENPDDGCDFHIVFTVGEVDYDFSNCSETAYIEATIDCTIDAGAANFKDDEVLIQNNAMVSYGNAGESEWAEADVYEYGFIIFKYANDEAKTPLANAEFQLSKTVETKDDDGDVISTDTYYAVFTNEEGSQIYVFSKWTENPEEATTMVTDDTGYIHVDGLAEGEDTLTETKAPDGYNMVEDPITVIIEATGKDFTVNDAKNHTVEVINQAGTLLPGTGGMGTTLFYIIGAVLIIGAAVLFVTKRRLDKES